MLTINKIGEIDIFRLRLSRSCRHIFLWGRGYESVAECVLFIQVYIELDLNAKLPFDIFVAINYLIA